MTQGHKTTVYLAMAAVGLSMSAAATSVDAGGNPYQVIVENNVFRLKPPPEPTVQEPPKPPMPKLTLLGITTVGKKRAWLKMPPPPVKPGETPKGEQSLTMAEGDRDGELEMVSIDPIAGVVKLKHTGTEVALNFIDNGVKQTSVPALPGNVPPGTLPGGMVPQPNPGAPTAQPYVPGVKPLPTRTLRLPTSTGGAAGYNPPATGYNPGGAGYIPPAGTPVNSIQVGTPGGAQTLPSFNFNRGTAAGNVPLPPTQQLEQLSPEEQIINLEIQREQNQNNPLFPPLPPTPLTPNQQQRQYQPGIRPQ